MGKEYSVSEFELEQQMLAERGQMEFQQYYEAFHCSACGCALEVEAKRCEPCQTQFEFDAHWFEFQFGKTLVM